MNITGSTAKPAPLSDQDLERLDHLLETHAVPHDGMSLEMLDGFLSALIVSPELVMPSEFMSAIWNHEPVWANESEALDAYRLVMGLWNDIVSRLQIEFGEDDEEAHAAAMPLLAYPSVAEQPLGSPADDEHDPFAGAPSDFPLAAAWALGFLRGVDFRQQAWERWAEQHEFVEEDLGMIEMLALFSTEQAEELGMDPDDIPDFHSRLEAAAELPAMLQDLDALRREQLRPQPVRRAETPGRNDPCPCGSGKKFKVCCGAPNHLH